MVEKKISLSRLEQGDIIKVSFDPIVGHEHAGYRPALVLSNNIFHKTTGFALCMPITSKKKGLFFEIEIIANQVQGTALPHSTRMFDLQTRKFVYIEKCPNIFLKKAKLILMKVMSE